MIIPIDLDYLKWAERYNIRIKVERCPKCNIEIITDIPFAISGYRGLKSKDHGCGEKYTRKTLVPIDKEETMFWKSITDSM